MVSLICRLLYFIKKLFRLFFDLKRVHFIGDSHTDVFWYMDFSPLYFWKIAPKIKVVHGATASGLLNPNSKTKALVSFKEYLKNEVKKDDYVVFQLGEVDCGFTIWYRAEKHGLSVEKQTDLAIKNYLSLVKEAKSINGNKTIVCSAVLPTIKDKKSLGSVASLRKEVEASIVDRTNLTLDFNARLEDCVKALCLNFISLDKYLFNKKTKIIYPKFLHKDPANHHLNPKELSKIINKELAFLIY